MPNPEVIAERRNQALIVTFNRPEHANAMTMDMAQSIHLILKNATTDKSVRAILLRGAGGNFMDGLDMAFYGRNMSEALDRANHLILPYHSAIRELRVMDKPVLAMVEGHVTGSGFSFMLAADLVIAGKSARFNTGYAENALSPDGGATYYLPRKVGLSRALEILMLCEEFDAAWAERLRLVNKVVEDDKLEEEALAWLDKLTAGPTKAYGAIKQLCNRSFEQEINAQLSFEHNYFGQNSRSFDFREAVRAMVEGRPAKFTGT